MSANNQSCPLSLQQNEIGSSCNSNKLKFPLRWGRADVPKHNTVFVSEPATCCSLRLVIRVSINLLATSLSHEKSINQLQVNSSCRIKQEADWSGTADSRHAQRAISSERQKRSVRKHENLPLTKKEKQNSLSES